MMKWIKNSLIIFVIINTLCSAFLVPLIYLDYEVRKEYITKVLCINKDKPELQCNGKCVLSQKLEQAKEHEEIPLDVSGKLELSFFFNACLLFEFNNTSFEIDSSQTISVLTFLSVGHLIDVFHPPQS